MSNGHFTTPPEINEARDLKFRLLNRDELKASAEGLETSEARILVEMYYDWQSQRVQTNNRIKMLSKAGLPHSTLGWMLEQQEAVEAQIKTILGKFAKNHKIGQWCMAQMGVGPVTSAAMIAYFDINEAPTAGHFFSYAGYTPEKMRPRKRGEKFSHNPRLKKVLFLLGESFVKQSKKEDSIYGQAYRNYVERVTRENEDGKWRECALQLAETRNYGVDTEAMKTLKTGKLPKLIIHQRGKHTAILLFLSHLHQVWRKIEGLSCPEPWIIKHGGHAHKIEPEHTEGLF